MRNAIMTILGLAMLTWAILFFGAIALWFWP